MMIAIDSVYRSLFYAAAQLAPSGVAVLDGELYGLTTDIRAPSIAVTLEDVESEAIELGALGVRYHVIFHIDARSRYQRDTLKTLLYTYVTTQRLPLYHPFAAHQDTPASGVAPVGFGEFSDRVTVRDMPLLDQGREQLFWSAIVFTDLLCTGE
jgi:hypothetical protein